MIEPMPLTSREEARRRRFFRDLVIAGDDTLVRGCEDDDVLEIMLNPDGSVWFDRLSSGLEQTQFTIPSNAAEALVNTIAGHLDGYIHKKSPLLEGAIPYLQARIEIAVPPVARAATFAIRKLLSLNWTLDDLVTRGSITEEIAHILRSASAKRQAVLFSGRTASGKTTLLNAFLREIPDIERLLVLEGTAELQLQGKHVVPLATDETSGVDLRALVRASLRFRPDRIIVGEMRGAEALEWIKAQNTGHPGGGATTHANSALQSLERIEECTSESHVHVSRARIAKAIKLLVYMEEKRVVEIVRVDGCANDEYLTTLLYAQDRDYVRSLLHHSIGSSS